MQPQYDGDLEIWGKENPKTCLRYVHVVGNLICGVSQKKFTVGFSYP